MTSYIKIKEDKEHCELYAEIVKTKAFEIMQELVAQKKREYINAAMKTTKKRKQTRAINIAQGLDIVQCMFADIHEYAFYYEEEYNGQAKV